MSYTLQYYDVVLIGVIAPVLVGFAIGYATSLPLVLVVPGLALLSVAAIAHGLFVNGPIDRVADLTEEVEELPGPAENFLE